METKLVTIFGQQLAGYLMLNKFVLVDMRPDYNGSGRNVFFFNDTPAIRKAMGEFRNRK